MAEVILMPRLSDTMTEGVVAAWHKKVGDTVKKGDLLAEIEKSPRVIFTTAYDEFALKAFEVNAFDYLLKPIDPKRLADAIQKLQTEIERLKIICAARKVKDRALAV